MKRLASLVATTMAFASIALAQDRPAATPVAPAKPAAQEPAKRAAAEAARPVAKDAKPMTSARRARRAEDARHCLEKASNTEIIKCAEEYL
jgi:hypothetical protein